MKSDVNDPNLSLPYHIRGAFRGFETSLSRYLATKNLPLSHFYILRLTWDHDGQTQKHIADKSFMTESVASQVIKAMEKNGLLKRRLDRSDARKKKVFLTPKGQKLRDEIIMRGHNLSNTHSPDITAEDIKTTINVLIKVREAFDIYNTDYMKQK